MQTSDPRHSKTFKQSVRFHFGCRLYERDTIKRQAFINEVGFGVEEYLVEHNRRWCVTPEYPNGTSAYFATVDANWNSAFPYLVGPTFYGVYEKRAVNSVNESTDVYTGSPVGVTAEEFEHMNINVFPNPASDLIAIQISGLVTQ